MPAQPQAAPEHSPPPADQAAAIPGATPAADSGTVASGAVAAGAVASGAVAADPAIAVRPGAAARPPESPPPDAAGRAAPAPAAPSAGIPAPEPEPDAHGGVPPQDTAAPAPAADPAQLSRAPADTAPQPTTAALPAATSPGASEAPLRAEPPPSAPYAPRPEPHAQLAGAVTVLARHGEGRHHLTLRLDPGELGRIEVAIARQHDGPADITLTVERPETLLRLMRDQDRLAHALDQAGLRSEQRTIQFRLAEPQPLAPAQQADPPRQPPPAADTAGTVPFQQPDTQRQDTRHQDAQADSRPGSRQPRNGTFADGAAGPAPAPRLLRLRSLDITA